MQQTSFSPPASTRSVIDKGTEDESCITGYRRNNLLTVLSHLCCLVLGGLPYLVAKWRPRWRLAATSSPCPIWQAESLLIVHKESREEYIVTVKTRQVTSSFPEQFSVSASQESASRVTSKLLQDETQPPTFNYFIYRHLRYGWRSDVGCYTRIKGFDSGLSTAHLIKEYSDGISPSESASLLQLHGANHIDVEIPTYLSLLIDEVLHPFYIFQMGSMVLWSLDDYVYYATCILLISLISVGVSLYETRRQAVALHDMVAQGGDQTARVRRRRGLKDDDGEECDNSQIDDNDIEMVNVNELVPGDLIVLPRTGCIMSCDAALLTGTAIVNEAMLTGESVPVTKSALPPTDTDDVIYHPDMHKAHTIFCGTQVIQTRFYGAEEVQAVVVRTGFHTSKGELVRSILFPRPTNFKFYQDSIRFILVLFGIATVGMAYCCYLYISRGAPISMIILRVLDIITIVVPPALPAAMTVGTVYAQSRLRRSGIFCTSPARINVCGKIKLVCFDKTGTLTEDGLDLKWVISAEDGKFKDTVEDVTKLDDQGHLKWSLASCHSLTTINNELTGDPLDAKMFEGTGWTLEEQGEDNVKFDKMMPTVVKPVRFTTFSLDALPLELGIIKQFAFSSSLARMSVIVRELSSSNFLVFSKGAPEKMEDICLPESIPPDFHVKLKELTLQGYRVIALTYKPLEPNINWIKVQKIKRDLVEKDLIFLGFLVMQNTLKPQTEGVIRQLKDAELKVVMITGDNLLTAISVSRDSGIISPEDRVVIVEAMHREDKVCLQFTDSDGSFIPDDVDANTSLDTVVTMERSTHLALTGKTWAALTKFFPELVPRIMVKGTVFARMSPDQKADLVEQLQTLGYIVSMCGDGANDCGALKAAHVGVSLSEAEASVAAPFTSKIANISCIPTLILEGRCALVTSFGVFKYMALYSMIQFISVLILYTEQTNLGDTQFLYIDLVITTTVAVLMGRTEAWKVLVKKRPPGSLVAGYTMFSIILQIFASLAGQLGALFYLKSQTWYTPVQPADEEDEIVVDATTTTIFIVSSYQYLALATVFSSGPPYRKPFYTNLLYFAALVGLCALTAVLLFLSGSSLQPFPWIQDFFELETLHFDYKLAVMMIVAVNVCVNVLLETLISAGTWVKKLSHFLTRKKEPKNKYKLVLREIAVQADWPTAGQIYTDGGPFS